MARLGHIALAVLLLASSAFASDVVDIKDDTFDSVIASHAFVLVEFFAPWCGHCKRLEPEWEKAATDLKGVAVLAKVDATIEKGVAEKFEIRGFPTIKIFRDGALTGDYEGGRSAKDIASYVRMNVGPAVTPVASVDALEALKKANPVVAVLFSATPVATFEAAAKALRNTATFAHVSDASAFGAETAGSIVLYKQFDEGREVLSGDATDEAIRSFVQNGSIRSFDEIGPENYKTYMARKLPMAWLFVEPNAHQEARDATAAAAKAFKGKISFVYIDASKYGQMAQRLGLKGDKWPALAIDHDQIHFAFDDVANAYTEEAVKKFAEDYLAGKLSPTVRSEAAPEQHTVNGVTTVVGSTFGELVASGDKDVLVEFYAPWCGHCKQLKPVWEKLGAAVKDVSHVRIAQIDATANDFDQKTFPVQGFPTIYFVAKGSKAPVQYEGDRNFDAFVTYLKEKASAPFTLAEAGGDEL